MKKVLTGFLIVLSLSLVGAKCQKPSNTKESEEVAVKKEFSTSTAFEAVKKTASDLGWKSVWDKEVTNGWANGGHKWSASPEEVLTDEHITVYQGISTDEWQNREQEICKQNSKPVSMVKTKFGDVCCTEQWGLYVFVKDKWAVVVASKNDDSQCSKATKIINIYWDNLKEVE